MKWRVANDEIKRGITGLHDVSIVTEELTERVTMSWVQVTLRLGHKRNPTIGLHQGPQRRGHSLCTPNMLVTRVRIAPRVV